MRIVDIFILFFVTSMTLIYVHSKPIGDYETILLPDEIIRLKKRNADSSKSYLEQCGIVKFPNVQQGVVNVLAFLDSSWPYSHRQAIMLKLLNERLRRSGLLDTLFFVVNVDPSYAQKIDTTEDDIEREAWLGVSPDEIERFSEIVKTTDSLAMSMNPDINLIQDNEDLGIWKELRGSRDQVLVIDRCGKLTYQVIVPWSILHFPYVKAAILSTYKDEPCGPCSIQRNDIEISTRRIDSTKASVMDDNVIESSNIPENLGTSTENLDETTLEWSTTEATTTKFLESLDITTMTGAVRYLIADNNYPTMEFRIQKYEEPTTLIITIDDINDVRNSHTTNVYTGLIHSTVDAHMDKTMEGNVGSQTVKVIGVVEHDSKIEKNLLNQEYNNNSSVLPDAIKTTTEENSHSQAFKVLGIVEQSNDSKIEKIRLDQVDKNDSSVIITDAIETTTEENSHSQTIKVLGIPGRSNDSTIEKNLPDQEDTNDPSLITTDTIDTMFETTTETNLLSQTVNVLGVAGQLNNSKNEESPLDQEDITTVIPTVITTDTIDTLIETTTEEQLHSETVKVLGIEEKSTNIKNQTNLVNHESMNHDTMFIGYNTIDTLIDTATEENLGPQAVKVVEIQGKSIDLKDEKNSLDQVDKNDTNIMFITTFDTTTEETYNFPTTQIIQWADALKVSKMDDSASVESVTDITNYDPTSVNSATTNDDHSTINPDTTYDIVDTTTEEISDSNAGLNENHAILSAMPIRIIMHAPHFHADADSTRMHEYLVLETGSPTNHGHLAIHDASRLYRGPQDFHEKMGNLKEIENKRWSMKNLIFNKDESTGLYGEVADYWRELGSFENYEDVEETEKPEDDRISEEASTNNRLWSKPSNIDNEKLSNDHKILHDESISSESKLNMETTEKLETDFTSKNAERPTESDEYNLEEEETRNKLIAHYSKLLPWIYYVLDK